MGRETQINKKLNIKDDDTLYRQSCGIGAIVFRFKAKSLAGQLSVQPTLMELPNRESRTFHYVAWKVITVGLLLRYLLLSPFIDCGSLIAEGALHPARRSLSDKDQKQVEGITVDRGSEWANVSILAVDGVNLSAWSIRPHDRNGGVVILLHGLSDNRLGMIGYAKLLLRHGFSIHA